MTEMLRQEATPVDPDRWLDARSVEQLAEQLDSVIASGDAVEIMELLDRMRRPALLKRIEPDQRNAWASRFLAGIEAAQLTVGGLFRQRVERYGSKVLFRFEREDRMSRLTWRRTGARVELIARALLALDGSDEPGPVAILSENRIEMALVDLACLTSGLFNVLVPANATDADVRYILKHSKARTVIVSSRRQLSKVILAREDLPELQRIVTLDPLRRRPDGVLSWEQMLAMAERCPVGRPAERSAAVMPDDDATVMYTSGTTGMPKGILFTHRNLVFKRFARALALPEIGEDDTFLCFLPLFHTFGRYFEMLGCVFWGASYCFLENPSPKALARGMRLYKPSVFISVPKKWIQLHEMVVARADPISASDDELKAAVQKVTGGKLRWGLSAAGHLDCEIFKFFQRHGVELLSGFGMTEGTGGITMTPVGEYRDDSLGTPLPGIETMLAKDGELLVKGPYVMAGYLDPPDGELSFDDDGWFHTGDLMVIDRDGHHRLVDRKKEIYKNIKGETIAPQRIENLFRDLEAVGRAFLVGDHREFNSVLIWPNPNYAGFDFSAADESEVRDHFRSIVVSVNKFLAPYERIVDFAVIDRDLDAAHDELTEKGSPRRTTIVRNFDETIRLLYRRTNLEVGDVELTLPNWLFQRLGLTAQDFRFGEGRLLLPSLGTELIVQRQSEHLVRIGSCLYRHPKGPLNLGALLYSPRLWLGNEGLVNFIELALEDRRRPGRTEEGIRWAGRATLYPGTEQDAASLNEAMSLTRHDLWHLDLAARMLASEDRAQALGAVQLLEQILDEEEGPLAVPARQVLARAGASGSLDVRRVAFRVLVATERDAHFDRTMRRFLSPDSPLLDNETREALCDQTWSDSRIAAFKKFAAEICFSGKYGSEADELAGSLFALLASYGAGHPAKYRAMRAFLVRAELMSPREHVRILAGEAIFTLRRGFRKWLGPTAKIAVDPETGEEYQWSDVIAYDDSVPERDRARLLKAISSTAVLREGVFLFSKALIRLSDIPPGGVWLRLLGERHGKSVYRVTIQTRFQGSYDVALNVNHELSRDAVFEEIHWLIVSGATESGPPLVEDFGGYWSDHDLWSEEFVPGETLARAMRRLSKREEETGGLRELWPFLAWTALSAYVDFWQRSGRRWELADSGMHNIVVPTDDYMTGVRIVSVSARRPHRGLETMIRSLREEFLEPAAVSYPELAGLVGWDVVFSSILEIVGEDEGLAMLGELIGGEHEDRPRDSMLHALAEYLGIVTLRGFLPRRLFFAAKRYRRWEQLNEDSTLQARARTLGEIYETYDLGAAAREHPEGRVRYFRETVFRDAGPALADSLEELIASLRSGETIGDELIDAVADLRSRLELEADEDYFLARLSFPYLQPDDVADFVHSHLGDHQSEIVVRVEDLDGGRFRIRHALTPKEVERLHGLFLAAKLEVRFRLEHRYLVAINERGQILGGLFYETDENEHGAHLEKIVVADAYRRKGVADRLMKELFNRLRAAGVQTVTTGFFRPQYFYGYGFTIEKRYAGLVKTLIENDRGGDGT